METIRTGASYGGKRAAEERYEYDFTLVPTGVWAQVDTKQDAWYFGIWANPFERVIITFCEGDLTRQIAKSDEEFVKAVRHIADYYGEEFKGIDTGFSYPMWKRFSDLGLSDLVHDTVTDLQGKENSNGV